MVLDDFGLNFTFYEEVPENTHEGGSSETSRDRKIHNFPHTEKRGLSFFIVGLRKAII